jgi:hypothetical protein
MRLIKVLRRNLFARNLNVMIVRSYDHRFSMESSTTEQFVQVPAKELDSSHLRVRDSLSLYERQTVLNTGEPPCHSAAHLAYQHLNDPSRDAWQKPKDVVERLGITPGSRVAELGAGGGISPGTWRALPGLKDECTQWISMRQA